MPKRIFISLTQADIEFGNWLAHRIEEMGHEVDIMSDWRAGEDFIDKMIEASAKADHTLALCTEAYFASPYAMMEFKAGVIREVAAIRARREGDASPRDLIPVRIDRSSPPDLFGAKIAINLIGSDGEPVCETDCIAKVDAALAENQPKRPPGAYLAKRAPAAEAPAAKAPLDNLPPLPAHALVDLPDAVAALDAALAEGAAALSQTIRGLGGVGKTTLAVAYARRPETAARFPLRWWVDAEQGTDRGLAALAAALGLATVETPEAEAVARARAWLKAPDRPALIVYDNAEEASFDPAVLPQSPGEAAALVTTRQRDFHGLPADREVALESWPVDIAAKFLMERSGSDDETGARKLAEALGGLALACEQAGAFCARTRRSPGDYLTLFEANPAKALAWERGAPAYPNSVAKTFALAIEKAAAEVPAAEAMLSVIAHLAPAPVPLAVFGHEAAPEGLRDPMEAAEAEAALTRWALADPAKVTDPLRKVDVPCLSLHRMVREAARARDAGREDAALQDAVRALAGAYPGDEDTNMDSWPRCRALAPHIDVEWAQTEWPQDAADATVTALDRAATFDEYSGAAYAKAEAKFSAALSVAIATHGEEAIQTATQLSNLAASLWRLGGTENLTRAQDAIERALRVDEAARGPDHPNIAIRLSILAVVLRALGGTANLSRARGALERALRIDEAAHGPNHPEVATKLSNLANVLGDLGGAENLTRAREALERAIRIGEDTYGPEHPEVATKLSNLATLFFDLGGVENLTHAREALERAIRIGEDTYGQEHPEVAIRLSNLANVLAGLGDAQNLARAREALERALQIDEAARGPDHPSVAIRLSNLANVLRALGGAENLTHAKNALERAIRIGEAAQRPDHPSVGISYVNLCRVMEGMGDQATALKLARRGHAIIAASFGPDHGRTKSAAS
ncbi:MAG: toll/interleukin-1 receptor domain-containing protein, partial [Pseudomonadota bacterium]